MLTKACIASTVDERSVGKRTDYENKKQINQNKNKTKRIDVDFIT